MIDDSIRKIDTTINLKNDIFSKLNLLTRKLTNHLWKKHLLQNKSIN